MENREFLEQIQQYAVRIGNAGDKELYGSGTLFLVSKRKKVCVLTAAHVVYSLMEKIKKQEIWTIQTHERAIVFTNKTNGDVDCNASVPTRKEANNEKVSLQ